MFHAAIEQLEASGKLIGPQQSFQEYLDSHGLTAKQTAQHISINALSDLRSELREASCMVFRLGQPTGSRTTHFALAKTNNGWQDYFFLDESIFSSTSPQVYLPSVSVRSLFAYQLLPSLTESSLVNLALASGLLPKALRISSSDGLTIPARGQSVFTFDFRPLSVSDTHLQHTGGQVEIDALFVGQREDKECLFVIEAKVSSKFESLAKHKLMYPVLALQSNIPSYMEVVPVYVRVIRNEGAFEFNIAECKLHRQDGAFGAIDKLECKTVSRFVLHGY